jgi:hypothetical protein
MCKEKEDAPYFKNRDTYTDGLPYPSFQSSAVGRGQIKNQEN